MKPAAFNYVKPMTLDDALGLLSKHSEGAQILAGGQSLMPTLNMRLSAPDLLIDINGLAELSGVKLEGNHIRIGALTRHVDVENSSVISEHCPLIASAMPHIAHPAIRNRGTFGGSIALADPAAELPACICALEAKIEVVGEGGERKIEAKDFFTGLYETDLQEGEIVTAVEVPIVASNSRLAFDELLSHQLAIGIMRNFNQKKKGLKITSENKTLNKFYSNLDFQLTNSQNNVIKEILQDLGSSNQMIRLLQGDVGSGKTNVALISMIKVFESNFQSALMVPTTILAFQHYENILNLLKDLKINILVLTGKDKGKERKEKLDEIAKGKADIIIGTHALIQDTVKFNNLGLAVIDEQHRFGVYQRMVFNHKNHKPNILVMSATPIPRTLTLAAYGDMKESKLIEKPLGRKPIITSSLSLKKENQLIDRIKEKIKNSSSKFYWVCPLIEESEELDLKAAEERYKILKKYFKNKVLLMHGRLSEIEKEEIMTKFKNEDYKILVSTTVIEVGVDIPSATTIVIEHAERFGLAQLHQLRGRVGRNDIQSYCILLHKDNIGEISKQRIDIMKQTNDGFKIAEEDLKIRGPGEILGKKQSGSPSFYVADLSFDYDLLEDAKIMVEDILSKNPKLENIEGENLRNLLYLQERDAAILTLTAG